MRKVIRLTEEELKGVIKEAILEETDKQKLFFDNVKNFNNVVRKSNNRLTESSINRMQEWLRNCDCAFITAFRGSLKDIRDKNSTYFGPNNDWQEGKEFTHEENRQKNKLMVAQLISLGYGVTKVKGVYPEGTTNESSEESYLVVNRNNDTDFLNNLLRIAEYYNQDSIYYKEKGATEGYLIGTNNSGYPEYHQKANPSILKTDTASNYMSRMGNKAFSFIGKDAERVADRKEAMDSIEKTRGTDDEFKQRYWKDNDSTTFQKRKENRKQQMMEFVSFWRQMTEGGMLIKEDIHPLTRMVMGQMLRNSRKNKHILQ